MTNIERSIKSLQLLLRRYAVAEKCFYFDVPLVMKKEEEAIMEFGYQKVDVTTMTGEAALQRAIAALLDFYVPDNNYSRRFVKKHPGIVVVDGPKPLITAQVNEVNAAKDAFKFAVQQLGKNAEEKWAEVHNRFMHLITTTVYRKIHCFDEPVHRVNFNWVSRPRCVNLSKSEVTAHIDAGKNTVPPSMTEQSWFASIDADKTLVEHCNEETFTIRRRIKLRPESSVKLENKDTALGYSAGLPYILFNYPAFFTPLDTFDASAFKPRARKEDSMRLIIKRMNLYASNHP